MDTARAAVYGVTLCIVVLAVATGPVGPIDIEDDPEFDTLNDGNATVTVVSAPETATVQVNDSETAVLDVSPSVVEIANLSANPSIDYRVRVKETGRVASSFYPLEPRGEGRLNLSIKQLQFEREEVADITSVELTATLRAEGGERAIIDRQLSVDVEEQG